MLIYPAAGYISTCSPGSRMDSDQSPGSSANNIYSPSSDKLTEVQLYMSTSCQPGSRVVRAFSDVEKPFLFSDLAVKAPKSENKKGLSMSEKSTISSLVNKRY